MMKLDKRLIALGVVVLAAASVGLGLFASNGGSTTTPQIPSPSVWRNHFGVIITPAENNRPAVSASRAAAAATHATGGSVLNHALRHCSIPGDHPAVSQDCYLELMDPTRVIAGQKVSWFVVMVNPTTGKPFQWFSNGPASAPPVTATG